MRAGGRPSARGFLRVWQAVAGALVVTILPLAILALLPPTAEAEQQFQVWRSAQFGMRLSHPTTWTVTDDRSDPERGDVLILGNDTSALLVGLLHDTRTPQQMADDLIQAQKEQTPDLAVVDSQDTATGSKLMFLQYTIRPGTDAALLIDEKVLLGTLRPGVATITLRGMVPDRADVESQFDEIEGIISTLAPDR